MGLAESIGKFLSRFIKPPQGWEDNLTKEQIDDMERQGCDVTELRQKYNARMDAEKKFYEDALAMIDMGKLDACMGTPRNLESAFVKDVIALNKLSNKRQALMAEAPIVYGAVVQAHHALWKPGNYERLGVVFVFAMDKEHQHDTEFLRLMADKISTLKNSTNVPQDCQKFIKTLRDDQSMFCFKVGDSISEGADLWCATYTWDKQTTENLPGGFLPATKIVPLMMLEYPKVNQFADFEKIPVKYYTQ